MEYFFVIIIVFTTNVLSSLLLSYLSVQVNPHYRNFARTTEPVTFEAVTAHAHLKQREFTRVIYLRSLETFKYFTPRK